MLTPKNTSITKYIEDRKGFIPHPKNKPELAGEFCIGGGTTVLQQLNPSLKIAPVYGNGTFQDKLKTSKNYRKVQKWEPLIEGDLNHIWRPYTGDKGDTNNLGTQNGTTPSHTTLISKNNKDIITHKNNSGTDHYSDNYYTSYDMQQLRSKNPGQYRVTTSRLDPGHREKREAELNKHVKTNGNSRYVDVSGKPNNQATDNLRKLDSTYNANFKDLAALQRFPTAVEDSIHARLKGISAVETKVGTSSKFALKNAINKYKELPTIVKAAPPVWALTAAAYAAEPLYKGYRYLTKSGTPEWVKELYSKEKNAGTLSEFTNKVLKNIDHTNYAPDKKEYNAVVKKYDEKADKGLMDAMFSPSSKGMFQQKETPSNAKRLVAKQGDEMSKQYVSAHTEFSNRLSDVMVRHPNEPLSTQLDIAQKSWSAPTTAKNPYYINGIVKKGKSEYVNSGKRLVKSK